MLGYTLVSITYQVIQVSFAKEPYQRDDILQKRLIRCGTRAVVQGGEDEDDALSL